MKGAFIRKYFFFFLRYRKRGGLALVRSYLPWKWSFVRELLCQDDLLKVVFHQCGHFIRLTFCQGDLPSGSSVGMTFHHVFFVCRDLSSGWSLSGWPFAKAVFYWDGLSPGWCFVRQVFYHGKFVIRVVSVSVISHWLVLSLGGGVFH